MAKQTRNPILISTLAALIAGASPAVFAQSLDRNAKLTDLAALGMQDMSINKLKKLVKQYQGAPQEPELLSRLADLYMQRSGITFRISEGTSVKTKTSLYHSSLEEGIKVFSELLRKYPYHANAANARFKRGKAFKELGRIKEAREDYLYLDQNFPTFTYIDSALNDLADFAQDTNHHQEALTYLSKIEKMTESEYYPIALHKSAWSYFNLGIHHSGIDYLGKEINFYFDRVQAKLAEMKDVKDAKAADKTAMAAETAFLEGAFNDLALFSFECFNKKVSDISISSTLSLFKKLDRSEDKRFFGPSILKFAKLLKAYTIIDQLDNLKVALIKDYVKLPETTEVALLMFGFYFERHEYNRLPPMLSDLNEIRKDVPNSTLNTKMEGVLSNALSELHKQVLKNKKSTELNILTRPLIALTEGVSDLLGTENTTSVLANYALAETSFEIQDYPRATRLYLDLTKPAHLAVLKTKNLSASALGLRLLSSRFRELKNEHVVNEKTEIHALNYKPNPLSKEQTVKMNEWVTWVDLYMPLGPEFYAFAVEAAKLVYDYGDTVQAVARLEKIGFLTPTTVEGQSAMSMALDTLAKSEDYPQLYDVSSKVLSVPKWFEKDFLTKVKETNADAFLKITLKTEAPEQILARTKECLKKYSNMRVGLDCELLQARTELKLNHFEEAEKQLTAVLPKVKDQGQAQSLLLLRADARSKLGKFDASIQDLSTYQSETGYKDASITQNILQHYWFKGDHQLDTMLKNPKVCSGKNEDTCDQYRVIKTLENHSAFNYLTVFRNTAKAGKEVAPLWALIALKDVKKIPFQDRLILLQRLASNWDKVNPLVQIRLFPELVARVNETLESIRISAPGIAPLTAEPATIERRMHLLQDVDMTFAKVMKLTWIEIKIKGAEELGQIYTRTIQDFQAIQTPEELLKPFFQKVKEINQATQQLQEMAMHFNTTPVIQTDAAAKKDGRAPASVETTKAKVTPKISVESLLLSKEVKDRVPEMLWGEWKNGVENSRRDFLFHLVSVMEGTTESVKAISPILRGLVLLQSNASTEAFEMIRSAPDSPWKASLVTQFQTVKAEK